MEKQINKLNSIYANVLKLAEEIGGELAKIGVKHKIGFYNNHEIKVGNKFIKEIYPIPIIYIKKGNVEVDIGLDLVSSDATPKKVINTLSVILSVLKSSV